MTAQTVSNAVEKRDAGPAELVRQSRDWFNTILPSHVDAGAFVALTLALLRKNPSLARAAQNNSQSFMAALSECARLGLVPGDTYHLVPFGSEITGIVDYKGEIELIYRAGAVSSVKAEIVYSKDHFRYTTDMDRPEHAPDWFGDRGELIGAYAYAVMQNGATSKVVVYSKAEIDRVKEVSKTWKRSDSPWTLWYDRMALKTVIHRLENFVPTSAEYRREQLRAAAEISQQVNSTAQVTAQAVPHVRPGDADYVDAEIVDDTPEPSPAGTETTPGSVPSAAPSADVPAPAGEAPATPSQVKAVWACLRTDYGYTAKEEEAARAAVAMIAGSRLATLESLNDLTAAEASRVLDQLHEWAREAKQTGERPRDILAADIASRDAGPRDEDGEARGE